MNLSDKQKHDLLKKFMKEHFSFTPLRKVGFFTKEMKNDYEAQAKKICEFFGLESVYEYGSEDIRCHINYANPDDKIGLDSSFRPLHVNEKGQLKCAPFVEVFPSIYE